jgi:hypothetical protein
MQRTKNMSRSASAIPLQIEGHSGLETEIVTNLMTESEVSKRLNLSVASLRWPRGSRGVVLHDRSDRLRDLAQFRRKRLKELFAKAGAVKYSEEKGSTRGRAV